MVGRRRSSEGVGEVAGSGLAIRLLGGFAVLRDGVPLTGPWRTEKARTLVKLLALAPDQLLHRDQALEYLWPELDPAAAANNLYFTLHAARRMLDAAGGTGATSLIFRAGLLRLAPPGGLATDVAAFEAAAGEALGGGEAARYEAAIALYAGELLPEDRYADWASGRRERLQETYLALLGRLAEMHAGREEWATAIGLLERVVEEDATREEGHAGLMRALTASGQRGRALRQYAELRAILRREVDAEPDAATQALYTAILASGNPMVAVAPASAPTRGNVPVALTRFIGREDEIARLGGLLTPGANGDGARLVTLTGSGGCGKTRLALEVATGRAAAFADGVWLVELVALDDPAMVSNAVAQALGVREVPGQAVTETLVVELRPKALLLILDNCEHLLDACAELVARLLAACPLVRLLATSREALQLPGEVIWRVPSLGVPPDAGPLRGGRGREAALGGEAARLLLDRIALRRPAFAPTDEDATAVATICRRLDGIPLALELAAGRAAYLTLPQIAARLDDALGLLTGGGRAALSRHQTLRATLEWSYGLLDRDERLLLGRLAIFAGGCTLEAAESVCAVDMAATVSILDVLARLVDKSLVQIEEERGELRYRLLEMTRQFARERLGEGEAAAALRERHLAYYVTLAEEIEPRLRGAQQARWFGVLDREEDNLRAALRRALDWHDAEHALRLAGALFQFWVTRWKLGEGGDWLEGALDLAESHRYPAARAKALIGLGGLSWRFGDPARAEASLREGLHLARSLDLAALAGHALIHLSYLRQSLGEPDAEDHALEAATVLRAAHDLPGLCSAMNTLGEWARLRGDYRQAIQRYEEAQTIAREIGEQFSIALVSFNLSFAYLRCGDAAGARAALAESTRLNLSLGKIGVEGPTLEAAAALACVGEQPPLAARFFGAAQSWHVAAARARRDPADQAEYDFHAERARAALGAAAYATAWEDGRALPLAESFAEALDYLGCS